MKRSFCFLIVLILVCSLLFCGSAASPTFVVDDAGLLTEEQLAVLNAEIDRISGEYQVQIRILTVNSIGTQDPQSYADSYFNQNNLGYGTKRSGILLLLSMENRDWAVTTNGNADRFISYNDIGNIMDSIAHDLSTGRYYEAFSGYLSGVEKQLELGAIGLSIPVRLLIALGVGLLVAGIVLLILRSQMNTVNAKINAKSYICESSYDLFRCCDFFLYSTTSRVRKEQSSSSSGSSSGHGGRSGKF